MIFLIVVATLVVLGLSLSVVALTPNLRTAGPSKLTPNGTVSHQENGSVVRIAPPTKKPRALFDAEYMTDVVKAVAADSVARSLTERSGAIAGTIGILCTGDKNPGDLVERLDGAVVELRNQLSTRPKQTAKVKMGTAREQVALVRTDHLILTVKPSLSGEKVIMLFISGSPTVEVKGPCTLLIFCMDDKDAPHIIAEGKGINVYFLGGEKARLSVVDGTAHLFGRCSVSGVDSNIVLHGQTKSVGGFRCDIHAFNASQIKSGEENTDCKTVLYDASA